MEYEPKDVLATQQTAIDGLMNPGEAWEPGSVPSYSHG
jgi:hypothetical protein